MNNTKLIQLLKTFSANEFNEFGKFINSPFHNESPKMILFYDYLKNYYPDFDKPDFTKENIFKKLYGTGEYDDKKIRERFSDLLTLAEEYLGFLDVKSKPLEFKSHTLQQLSKRKLEIHFNKKVKETQAILDKRITRDADHFYDIYSHHRVKSNFYVLHEMMGKSKFKFEAIAVEFDLFMRYVLTKMLAYYMLMKDLEGLLNYKFDYVLYEPIMKFIDENNFDNNPLLRLYSLALKLKNNIDDDELYFKAKNLFIESSELLDGRDKMSLTTSLHNIALKNFMKEKDGFEREPFEIYKLLLECEANIMEDGWMAREIYCNGVTIPLSIKEPEWAENFVKYYTVRVAPDKRENALLFVTALLDYEKKKYDSALKSLSKITGKDFFYYLRIKTLRSKIYFEQKEYEKVLNLIGAFKNFLTHTPSVPEVVKKRYTNYMNALNKLTLLVTSVDCDDYDVVKLEAEIKNFLFDDITTNKIWLLEKVSEFKKQL